jgi:hypothetical protein
LPDTLGYPLGPRRPRNPEQITVSDESAIAQRHPALERTRSLMQRNDALAFLRLEPTREDLAVMKSFPHVDRPIGGGRSSGSTPWGRSLREPDGEGIYLAQVLLSI